MPYNTCVIIFIIVCTTFVQKYYFLVLNSTKNIHSVLWYIFGFIIRFWLILHEICHLFFGFVSGNKIVEIRLFDKNDWRVTFQSKNYIWDLSKYGMSSWYLFALILNQIGLFLISFWPLFFWIALSYFIFTYFWITDIDALLQIKMSYSLVFIILFYSIFIPSFALSFEDIEKFFISRQENIAATVIWSIINFLIFFSFILIFSYFFVNYFIFFWILFLMMFFFQAMIYVTFLWIKNFFYIQTFFCKYLKTHILTSVYYHHLLYVHKF